jgi:hypothetical protein
VGREVCSSRRIRTNTPLQALALLNDSVYIDLSIRLADRVYQPGTPIEKSIRRAYELVSGQLISDEKLAIFMELFSESQAEYRADPQGVRELYPDRDPDKVPDFAALVLVANALFNLDEVITRS